MADGLEIRTEGPVVTAVIERGDANRLSMAMCRELTDILLRPPSGAHVLRIEAAGDAFCLGRDREANEPGELRDEVGALIGLNTALGSSSLVSVAVVQGDAAGFGVGVAALADVAIAAQSAKFWFPEVEIDLAPTVVLSWLPRVVGRQRAFQLTATAERIPAHRAAALGLVTRVVSDEGLDDAAAQQVKQLTRFEPRVHREIKAFLALADGLTPDQAYALSTEKLIVGSMGRRRLTDVRPVGSSS